MASISVNKATLKISEKTLRQIITKIDKVRARAKDPDDSFNLDGDEKKLQCDMDQEDYHKLLATLGIVQLECPFGRIAFEIEMDEAKVDCEREYSDYEVII